MQELMYPPLKRWRSKFSLVINITVDTPKNSVDTPENSVLRVINSEFKKI